MDFLAAALEQVGLEGASGEADTCGKPIGHCALAFAALPPEKSARALRPRIEPGAPALTLFCCSQDAACPGYGISSTGHCPSREPRNCMTRSRISSGGSCASVQLMSASCCRSSSLLCQLNRRENLSQGFSHITMHGAVVISCRSLWRRLSGAKRKHAEPESRPLEVRPLLVASCDRCLDVPHNASMQRGNVQRSRCFA